MSIEQSAPRPWYKQVWPWILIALPSSAVIGCIISINLAVTNAPTITDDSIGRFARPEASVQK